jgi:hypothetical protein
VSENQIRRRAKANFPTVLLTLLSIVQAFALELMWTHINEHAYLYELSFMSVLGWLQVLATLFGILLIWLVYSDLVLRLTWVPTTTDAIFPFLVGILEFVQIGVMGLTSIGPWFLILGVLFAAMAWIIQTTMMRARLDQDNADFFKHVGPATMKDHLMSMVPALVLLVIGILIWLLNDHGWFSMMTMVLAVILLANQIRMNHIFTQRSYNRD